MASYKPEWLEALCLQKFFTPCSLHRTSKKNEKNICCLDCCRSICPHCILLHRSHRLLQIRRYVYHEVVRLEDMEKLIDCSNIQAYTINASKVLFIKKRPQNRQLKGSGNYCTSCDRSLQEPFIHCSLGCKVDSALKHYQGLTPFLRVCKTLRLGPDFFVPQDAAEDEMPPHTTVMHSSSEPSSGGSDNMSFSCTEYVCGRMASKISREDMATSMSRRKRVPRRSPLC